MAPGCASTASRSAKAGGTIDGAAFVGWDCTYSFNADGRRIPVEQHGGLRLSAGAAVGAASSSPPAAAAPSTFRATTCGSASTICSSPRKAVGQVTGTLALRGEELSGEIDVASPRLNVTGTGRIGLAARAPADLTFRFHDSSLDPYVRLFVPKLSPYHHGRRERVDPRRRLARRRRSAAGRRDGRLGSR